MAHQKTGRPFVEGITEALMDAAEKVMARDGYFALTVDGLSSAVGTTRPTFYRRFPNIAHLALAVIKSRYGTKREIASESLLHDLILLQREEVAMFSDPVFGKSLLGILEATAEDAELSRKYREEFIAPRRENVDVTIRAAVARGELPHLPSPAEVNFACELLVGPILARVLLPGSAPLDEDLAQRTARAALGALTSA